MLARSLAPSGTLLAMRTRPYGSPWPSPWTAVEAIRAGARTSSDAAPSCVAPRTTTETTTEVVASVANMSDDAMNRLKELERSLGGPDGAPLLIGCDEPPGDITEALESLEPDTEYRLCVREFQGADTYIITARTPTATELAELDRIMGETSPADGDEGEPEDESSGDEDGD